MPYINGPVNRFLRVVFAFVIAAALDAALANLGILELPDYLVPVVAAGLNALAKWLRDKYPSLQALPV